MTAVLLGSPGATVSESDESVFLCFNLHLISTDSGCSLLLPEQLVCQRGLELYLDLYYA